jgi:hypothetical protein
MESAIAYYRSKLDDYKRQTEKHNSALVRCISVSDPVLREITKAEYQRIAEELQQSECILKESENAVLSAIADNIEHELEERLFIKSDLIKECQIAGLDLKLEAQKYRMRPIYNLEQKRELCLLLNEVGLQIHIIDISGKRRSIIGKQSELTPIRIYVKNNTVYGL